MTERMLIEYITNAIWQVPLLAAGAWLLIRAARPGSFVQHWIWLAVLGLTVVLPLHGIGTGSPTPLIAVGTQPHMIVNSEPGSMPPKYTWLEFAPQAWNLRMSTTAVHWLAGLYWILFTFGLLRIAWAWRAARHLLRHSREITLSRQNMAVLENCSQRLRVKLPKLRESSEVSSPAIMGVKAPVLLLPENFSQHTEDEVKAALCHELAHIYRRDYLANLLCRIAALPVAWHPVTYGVQRRINRTREMVCDAMAARQMQSEIGYAKCLLALAQNTPGQRGIAEQAQALGLFSNNTLEERMMRLTETKTAISVRARLARVVSGAAMMIATTAVAAAFHIVPTLAASRTAVIPQAEQSAPAAFETQSAASAPGSSASPLTIAHGDKAHVIHKNGTYIHRWKGTDGKPFVMVNREPYGPDAEEQHRMEKDFQKQMADAQRQVAAATAKLNSPEFRQRMADMQRQVAAATAKLDGPEFQRQMTDAQRQVAAATAKLNSPEFRQKMADMQRQVAAATAKLNSPEFRQQIANAQRQVAAATAKLNGPEFRQQMENAEKQIEQACRRMAQTDQMLKDSQTRCGNIQIK